MEHGSAWMSALIQYHEMPVLPTARLARNWHPVQLQETHRLSLCHLETYLTWPLILRSTLCPRRRRDAKDRAQASEEGRTGLQPQLCKPPAVSMSRMRLLFSFLPPECFNLTWEMRSSTSQSLHVLIHKIQKRRL